MVILLSTKCFLFIYIYIDLLKLKAYKQFENNVKWYWSLKKKPTCDTPTYVTWRSLPSNQFVLEIVSTLPCASGLIRHKLLFVYFFKELISFIGSLDECHTSVLIIIVLTHQFIYIASVTVPIHCCCCCYCCCFFVFFSFTRRYNLNKILLQPLAVSPRNQRR